MFQICQNTFCRRLRKIKKMCEINCHHYEKCNHLAIYDYARCAAAWARPNQALCVPSSGKLRDLPRVVDVRDQDIDDFCPACRGETPPSSRGSQGVVAKISARSLTFREPVAKILSCLSLTCSALFLTYDRTV